MKFLAMMFVFALSGCDLFFDVDEVELQTNANPTDAEDPDEFDLGGFSLTNGELCENPTGGSFDKSTCDPVDQTGCANGEYCYLTVQEGALISACRPVAAEFDGPQEACETLSCQPGYNCIRDVNQCRRICDRATAKGCTPGSFCTPFEGTTIGYCANLCVQ